MPRVLSKSESEGDHSPLPNLPHSARKKHTCPTCDRCFTTSGHLARHSRVHTGEKNHKCPFPGCDTRCSRQDNLQQHYRIHLSPGSRRTSSRTSVSRRGRRGNNASVQQDYEQPPLSPPPLIQATLPSSTPSMSPPPLEHGRASGAVARSQLYSPPPDSPPPLAHATIPTFQQRPSPSSSATSSPDISYAAGPSSFPPSAPVSPPLPTSTPNYAFRHNATAYQEHSGFANTSETYSPSEGYANGSYSLPRIETLTSARNTSPPLTSSSSAPSSVSIPHSSLSRHSISHISHSQSAYPRLVSSMNARPSTRPPSPTSAHSASHHSGYSHSGPPTPNGYTSYDGENGQPVADSPALSAHPGGTIIEPSLSRFSPPPVLAPIQGFASHDSSAAVPPRPGSGVRVVSEHYDRKSPPARNEYSDRYAHYDTRYAPEEPRFRTMYGLTHERSELSAAQTYMSHQAPPMTNYHDIYSSGGDVSLHHGAWKADHFTSRGMKSINALVQ